MSSTKKKEVLTINACDNKMPESVFFIPAITKDYDAPVPLSKKIDIFVLSNSNSTTYISETVYLFCEKILLYSIYQWKR